MPYSIETDRKWQKRWEETNLYKFDWGNMDRKLYCLEMFSYPSGANLHVGHWYNFALSDSYTRMKRMQGFEIFHPMGFDAFGLPAENYAIQTGIHPKDSTLKNIDTMQKQLKEMGATYDWDFWLATCMPDYYKWTQWLFLRLFENGLAYRKLAPVNWCPNCQTVLANEQVIDGGCERCSSEVIKKNLTQWFFKITDYADELLNMLPSLDWPEKTKKIQVNWIGRSEGAEITFKVDGFEGKSFTVFTTRADTLFGVTYIVLAPENDLVDEIAGDEYREQIENYRESIKKHTEIERMSTGREKTGVPIGANAINPITGEKVPIWIADYVLSGYGTGCVMAVPGHDARDYEFAGKFGLPITRVIRAEKPDVDDSLPFVDYGIMMESAEFNGLSSDEGAKAVIASLEARGRGEGRLKVNYRLRDWLVSRQRYWGSPIPIVHCDTCGAVPVPDKDLPVELPYDVEFTPDGESPLKKSAKFMNTICPKCGGAAKRDPDTLDTFVCSSWYYLRYPDNKNSESIFDSDLINKIMPVDIYVGGAEHAAMHLLYARFINKALRDMGYVKCDEPFRRLVHQGVILGADGNKMSKSLGNTVSPDEYVHKYGSDVFRMYLGFGFSYVDGGPWDDAGIKAVDRFLSRAERFVNRIVSLLTNSEKFASARDALARAAQAGDGTAGCGSGNAVCGGGDERASGANAVRGGDSSEQRGGAANAVCGGGDERVGGSMSSYCGAEAELNYVRNNSIKFATIDTERLQFNTAISRSMELLNALYKYDAEVGDDNKDRGLFISASTDFLKLISPFAPHFAEEMWERFGFPYSIFNHEWPLYDESALIRDVVELAVQVNGAVRFKIEVPSDMDDKSVEAAAIKDDRLPQYVEGKSIVKVIVIRGRLVNIVAR